MFTYGKTATNAISVMSYLAGAAPQRVGSSVIAESRGISPVLTAKLLTQLSSAGLVSGQPGPGGGYTLNKPAGDIRLIDIVSLFEQIDRSSPCPFGSGWCGNSEPCPLHDTITDMITRNLRFMEQTRLSVFQNHAAVSKRPKSPAKPSPVKPAVGKPPRRASKKSNQP